MEGELVKMVKQTGFLDFLCFQLIVNLAFFY